MNDDDLIALVAAARPEPPPALRGRILAAAASVPAAPPWWARVRTWAAAAVILLMVNWQVMSQQPSPVPVQVADTPALLAPGDENSLGPVHRTILHRNPPAAPARTFALISRFSHTNTTVGPARP